MNIKIRDYLLNHLGAFVVGVVGSLLVAYIIGQWTLFPQTTELSKPSDVKVILVSETDQRQTNTHPQMEVRNSLNKLKN